MIVSIINNTNHQVPNIEINYVNEKGTIDTKIENISKDYFYEFKELPKTKQHINYEFVNWNNKNVDKNFNIKKMSNVRIFDYLIRELDESTKELIFANNTPKKYFCDIETEIIPGHFDPHNPIGQILTIALSTPDYKVFLFGLKDLSKSELQLIEKKINNYFSHYNKKITVQYQKFPNESELLYVFMNKFISKIPFLSGWNFLDFDWTYIINRCRILNIDISKALNCTPREDCFISEDRDRASILPKRKIIADYLDIFKTYDTSVKTKRSMKLDNIGDSILGLRKIQNSYGTLDKLYENDFLHFLYYNAVDAILVQLIDEKTNCWMVKQNLAFLYKISVYKADRKVICSQQLIQEKFWELEQKISIPNNNKEKGHDIAGGHVKEPKPNYYEDLCILDFSSLYPSIMRQFNISPETYVGQRDDKDIKIGSETVLMESKACFKPISHKGVLPRIIDELYTKRKEIQKESLNLEMQLKTIREIIKTKEV